MDFKNLTGLTITIAAVNFFVMLGYLFYFRNKGIDAFVQMFLVCLVHCGVLKIFKIYSLRKGKEILGKAFAFSLTQMKWLFPLGVVVIHLGLGA